MHIKLKPSRVRKGSYTWAFIAANGAQIANNQIFASRGNAARAAKRVVTSIANACGGRCGFVVNPDQPNVIRIVPFA